MSRTELNTARCLVKSQLNKNRIQNLKNYYFVLKKRFLFLLHNLVILCPALPTPSNGKRLGCPENAVMYYDTVCQFSCNNGYIGSGSQARRCQDNGTWSGQTFRCQSMFLHISICDNS